MHDGTILTKDIIIVSNLEHASELIHGYHQSRPWNDPSPLVYVRTPAIEAHRLSVSGGVPLPDFTATSLPPKYSISLPHLKKQSRRLCNMIANTKLMEEARLKAKQRHDHDGEMFFRGASEMPSSGINPFPASPPRVRVTDRCCERR